MADQFYGITDTGRERKNNEDTFIAQPTAGNKYIIACVIDGVGGYSGGEIAAELARDSIIKRLAKPSGDIIGNISNAFKQANEKIIEEKQQVKEHESMACVSTLALVDIPNNQFYYAHVGDTRLYLLRDESLIKISHDHSFVGFLEDSGRLTEEAAMKHPKRNEINKALGFEMQLGKTNDYIETGNSPFLSGDMLLLCSDGLTDMVSKQEITDILTGPGSIKDKCQNLIDVANHNGGRDNVTVVLVHNNKQQQQYDGVMPAAANLQKKNEDGPESVGETNYSARLESQSDNLPKSKTAIITVLTILMLGFLATTIWQYFQNRQTKALPVLTEKVVATTHAKRPRNKQEIKLQQAIDNVKGNLLILSDTAYTAPILINEAITIKKDSLFLKTKGKIVLQSDSGYTGSAFNVLSGCKFFMLDSLSINKFQTGIAASNNELFLKHILFNDCKLAITNSVPATGRNFITSRVLALTFKADSLPAKTK